MLRKNQNNLTHNSELSCGCKRDLRGDFFAGAASVTANVASDAAAVSTMLPPLPPGEEIYDIAPQLSVGLPLGWMLMHFLAWCLFAFLLWRFYLWLITPVVRVRVPIFQSPEKIARRAIQRLIISPVWETRQSKDVCEAMSNIFKDYIHAAHGIGIGAAATSDETLLFLQHKKIAGAVYRQAGELLTTCDRIKYTGCSDQDFDQESMLKILENLVGNEGWKR